MPAGASVSACGKRVAVGNDEAVGFDICMQHVGGELSEVYVKVMEPSVDTITGITGYLPSHH